MALLIFPFHVVILWLGRWFEAPISPETIILVGALLLSTIAGATIGEIVRRRFKAEVQEFVPPPPPPGWREKRLKRLQGMKADAAEDKTMPTRET